MVGAVLQFSLMFGAPFFLIGGLVVIRRRLSMRPHAWVIPLLLGASAFGLSQVIGWFARPHVAVLWANVGVSDAWRDCAFSLLGGLQASTAEEPLRGLFLLVAFVFLSRRFARGQTDLPALSRRDLVRHSEDQALVRQSDSQALVFGVAYGGAEAWFVGLHALSAMGPALLRDSAAFDAYPWWALALGGVERVLAIPIHMGLGLLWSRGWTLSWRSGVLYGTLAWVLHAGVDTLVLWLGLRGAGAVAIESAMAVFAMIGLAACGYVTRPTPESGPLQNMR